MGPGSDGGDVHNLLMSTSLAPTGRGLSWYFSLIRELISADSTAADYGRCRGTRVVDLRNYPDAAIGQAPASPAATCEELQDRPAQV